MSGKNKRLTDEDVMCIARHLVRYANCKPALATKRLLEIELIRNNFSKCTVYNYITGTRRLIKDGTFGSGMTKEMADAVRKVLNEQADAKNEPSQALPQESPTEVLVRLKKNFDKNCAKYAEIIAQLKDEKARKMIEYDDAIKLVEYQMDSLSGAFQRMSAEITEVEARGLLWQK